MSYLDEETEKVDALVAESRSLDEKINKLAAQAEADAKAAEARSAVAAVATPKATGIKVVSEPRTYTPESGHSFVRDAFNAQVRNDFAANERLARHMKEESVERRDVDTGNFVGLVVPQYLVDLALSTYAPSLDNRTSAVRLSSAELALMSSYFATSFAHGTPLLTHKS